MLRGSIAPHPVTVGSKDERRARPHLRWCGAHPGTAQAGLLGMTCAGSAPGYPQRKLAPMGAFGVKQPFNDHLTGAFSLNRKQDE